ncbi:epididymal-specific lipocalin-12 [Camelus ferus]|uniref:Epididymal-specific lipocalin-12 n=1 Tax=Camelus ferus TaxID=419612 RepID=A0A8B8SZG6_CAMFR|nr:epididymal-specific lipocalin-12 [Camelus ferus]
MGPWCALWVLLALLRDLRGLTADQALSSSVLQSFQAAQFQGLWFVLGLAGSTHRTVDRSLLSPFTATFELREDSRLEVSYAMIRGRRCVTWSYVLISGTQPGKFSVDNSGVPGGDPEEVQVYDTDYTTFALVLSRRQSGDQGILRIYLLCRMWAIQTEVLDKFVCLVRAQGLSDNNIVFPDLTDWSLHPDAC